MSCGTRLDRLLNLLSAGTTAATRNAAAEQIGEIQKYHPYDLQKLLFRVHDYLRDEKWETRIAAGQAIAAIALNVPAWNPTYNPSAPTEDVPTNTGTLTFDNFEIDQVLQYGTELLASGGAEYEYDESLDPKQRMENQKKQLERRMGVEIGGLDDMLLDESDFSTNQKNSIQQESLEEEETRRKTADIDQVLHRSDHLSARERNKKRREAKKIAKTKEQERRLNASSGSLKSSMNLDTGDKKKEFKNVVTEQPQKSDKIVIEAVADGDKMFNSENVWPFHLLSAILLNELFDPFWEVRHGAVVGLREILKIHCTGAGRTSNVQIEEQKVQNKMWLQDCCIRFLCIFALDRFGDYVSGDQVVVPVRETCAQAFGALVSHMDQEDVLQAFQILLKLQQSEKWEVRHGSLLGLKYLIAVRKDLIELILPSAIEPILKALGDNFDDVRSVAAEALLPVAVEIPRVCNDQLPNMLTILWDILLDLDDLTASTNSVMNLLASFYSIPETAVVTRKMLEEKHSGGEDPLATLVPRLWPFLLHNIASVRLATLTTFIKLFSIDSSNNWITPIIPAGLRYIFQTILLETKVEIIQCASELWKLFISKMNEQIAVTFVEQLMPLWLCLLSTPLGHPLNPSGLIIPDYHSLSLEMDDEVELMSGKRKRENIDDDPASKKFRTEEGVLDVSSTAQIQSTSTATMRDNGCEALGFLFSCISIEKLPNSFRLLQECLQAPIANQRLTAGLILEAIGISVAKVQVLPEVLYSKLFDGLTKPAAYSELVPLTQQMINNYQVLTTSMISFGAPPNVFQRDSSQLDMKIAKYTATTQFTQFMCQLQDHIDDSTRGQLKARQQQLLNDIQQIQQVESHTNTSVRGTMASVIVAWNSLPDKLNPIIRSLMTGIKKETVQSLQKRFAFAIASLVKQVKERKPCPNPKIISNICSSVAPFVPPKDKEDETQSPILEEPQEIAHRGTEFALQSLATVFGGDLLSQLPTLQSLLFSIITYTPDKSNELIATLQIYLILLPVISPELYPVFLELFPQLFQLVQSSQPIIRTVVARAIGMYCKVITLDCMKLVISQLLPYLSKTDDEFARLGVAEAVHYIIEYLEMAVIPYLVFLVVPTLGRMSDQSLAVRKLVTRSFATLVRLMPLESGVEDPEGFTEGMKKQKQNERKFLEQLLDGSKLDSFELSIPVNAQLRKYQQEGLNWLAFLQKYKLHGILCDDMGLGKTLQTLCIIVSDNYRRKCEYEKTKNPECVVLPSLVVCPPTVVGHWFHETKKFFSDYAVPILYTGNPSERSAIRDDILNYDIVILSYDILRNDIQFLEQIYWNYCALDEGHIIRNAKTKITKAAKRIQANHRLILSGTPIQNNVLELWSLFDFLMPGFLGTEKQFNQMYGKPILASRDPKCSQKDQERGTLALEALHRQVLPFLLRRVKEDVLHDLPPKIIQDYYCELSSLQKRLYEDFSHSPACQDIQSNIQTSSAVIETKKPKKKGTHIFQALQYLRKLCNHPLLVLNQQHPEYHAVMASLHNNNETLHSLHHAPKLMALKELLTECGIGAGHNELTANQNDADLSAVVQHRVLIFAQLKMMLDIIEGDLLKEYFPQVSYLRLDGGVHTSKRHDIVSKFNDDPTIDILLLTTHVGGLGLNLTGADTVIFVEHDWNPMKDLQAMDRAHRLGQTKVVNVYRLITKGTLEEKIMGLQKFKMNIANSVVNQENSSLRTMDTNQLLDLFDVSDEKAQSGDAESVVDDFGNVSTKKQSSNQIVESLEELWDDSQYTEEYNLDSFVSSLKK